MQNCAYYIGLAQLQEIAIYRVECGIFAQIRNRQAVIVLD